MKSFSFNPRKFGLKEGYLYEILATTFLGYNGGEIVKPNTACIGIRLNEKNSIKIRLYPNSVTLANLKANDLITINFVNNIYLYALAALKDNEDPNSLIKFSNQYYNSLEIDIPADDEKESVRLFMPYLNKAWSALFCRVIEEKQINEIDDLGKAIVTEFLLDVIHFNKIKDNFKLFNRAENLALEAIILTTRLKLAKDNNKRHLFIEIKEDIEGYIEKIENLGANKNALNAIRVIRNYLKTQAY